MQVENYMTERVDNQIAWYGRKSGINKRFYHWTNGGIIFCSALIPLVTGMDMTGGLFGTSLKPSLLAGMLGVLTASLSGFAALMKFQDKWTLYRLTSESLQREKILFETATAPYQGGAASFHLFVSNVERILAHENTGWYGTVNQSPEPSAQE
jgi:hypothetical protein